MEIALVGSGSESGRKCLPCGSMCREMPSSSASNARLERQQTPLPWDPKMEEVLEQPPHLILLDPSFLVYRKRRRKRISLAGPVHGGSPPGSE